MITPAIIFFRLFCSLTPDYSPVYYATFDSGDEDKAACEMTAMMFTSFYRSTDKRDARCWCNQLIPSRT